MAESDAGNWDPDLYLRFETERYAPFEDLLQLVIVRPDLDVVDLGCGTGELTRRLAAHLPGSRVLGIDTSEEMLERAREIEARTVSAVADGAKAAAKAKAAGSLRFETGHLEHLENSWDLVFSNAAIHWVDNHESLVPFLWSAVRPGGQMVIQLPSNHGHPAHRLLAELAGQEPFTSELVGWTRQSPVLPVEQYARLLFDCGGTDLTVFEKVYPHELPDSDAVAAWISGTLMRPYLARLSEDSGRVFLQAFQDRLHAAIPGSPVLFGFKRILFAARRPA